VESSDNKAAEFAQGLRDLADIIERNGGKAFPLPGKLYLQVDVTVGEHNAQYEYVPDVEATRKAMKKGIRGMGRGKKEKVYNDAYMTVNKEFGPYVVLQIKAQRQGVCRKVPTGNKIIHESYTIPRQVTEEFKWECDDPIFAAPDEVEAGHAQI
jgi:hypothetical protein